ncbi:MAG: BrnT family toxin [bacterium]|nr:BrnT family toxin [bacterium]
MRINKRVFEFEWDKGNIEKNRKHKVDDKEAEEAFIDEEKVIFKDKLHTTDLEERFILLGKTKKNRLLYIIFTERKEKIRIISARDVNKKEVYLYEETT